jgi:hypothetical protein
MGKGTGRGGGKGGNDLVKLLCVAGAGLGCSLGAWFSIVASQIDVACDALMIFKLREGGFCTGGEDILNGAASIVACGADNPRWSSANGDHPCSDCTVQGQYH